MLWQVGRLLCMEVKQLVGWNIRRVPKSVARQSRHWRIRRMRAPHGSAKNSRMVRPRRIGREFSLEGMLDSFTQRKSVTVNLAV